MVFKNIIVRADCIDGKVIPICFQASVNQPCYNIGRIISTTLRQQEGRIEYKCRLSKSDKVVTLVLEIKDNIPRWLVDMDWDVTKVSSKPVEEPVVKQEAPKGNDDITEQIVYLGIGISLILMCGILLLFEKLFLELKGIINNYDYNFIFIGLALCVLWVLFNIGVIFYKIKKCRRGKK